MEKLKSLANNLGCFTSNIIKCILCLSPGMAEVKCINMLHACWLLETVGIKQSEREKKN